MWEGTALTSPNGGTIMLNEKAKKELEKAIKAQGVPEEPKAGQRFPSPLDGGTDPAPPPSAPAPMQIWYGDPAEHPNAYIAITFETPNNVVVRDGNDETGKALTFSREQWAALVDPDGDGLGEPEGDKEHPANVRNPDDLHKLEPRGSKNKQ